MERSTGVLGNKSMPLVSGYLDRPSSAVLTGTPESLWFTVEMLASYAKSAVDSGAWAAIPCAPTQRPELLEALGPAINTRPFPRLPPQEMRVLKGLAFNAAVHKRNMSHSLQPSDQSWSYSSA